MERELKEVLRMYSRVDIGFMRDQPEALNRNRVLLLRLVNVAVQNGCELADALRWQNCILKDFSYSGAKNIYNEVMALLNSETVGGN